MPNNRFVIKENTPVENFPLLFFKLLMKLEIEATKVEEDKNKKRNKKEINIDCTKVTTQPTAIDYLLNPECYKFNRKGEELKPHLLKKTVEIFNAQGDRRKVYSPFVREYLNTLRENGFELLEFSTNFNLAVGLGIPAFFENGLTFHHTYGVPYLPGSSVKGLLRYAFWGEALGIYPFGVEKVPKPFELLTEDKEEALERAFKVISKLDEAITNSATFEEFSEKIPHLKDENRKPLKVKVTNEDTLHKFYDLFVTLFGTQKVEGKVIFADALAEEFKLGVDIMNPHFKDYYQSKRKEPVQVAEIYNPVPIQFLMVEEAIFAVPYKITAKGGRQILEKIIEKLLKEAFDLLGIGAKRRKGYGRLGSG